MEKLKKIEEILEPDERQKYFRLLNRETGELRDRTVKDFYEMANDVKLNDNVPEDVRSLFATAQNMLVYSWYFYPFLMSATMSACAVLEFALKRKFGDKKDTGGRKSFRELVEEAFTSKLVVADGFSRFCEQRRVIQEAGGERSALLKEFSEEMAKELFPDKFTDQDETPYSEEKHAESYLEILKDFIPYVRNALAHGSNMLSESIAIDSVYLCAEFINQLYSSE